MCDGEREETEHVCNCGHVREVANREAARRSDLLRKLHHDLLPSVPDIETEKDSNG